MSDSILRHRRQLRLIKWEDLDRLCKADPIIEAILKDRMEAIANDFKKKGYTITPKMSAPAQVGYCGICGHRTYACTCYPLDMEETPDMNAPVFGDNSVQASNPWGLPKPQPPQVKTRGDSIDALFDSVAHQAGSKACYICATSSRPTYTVKSSGMAICRECALQHFFDQ